MPTTTSRPRALLRASIAALGAWLVLLTLLNAFIVGRRATDENVFIDPPSTIYIAGDVEGRPGTPHILAGPLPNFVPRVARSGEAVQAGDLVVVIERQRVHSVAEARTRLQGDVPREVVVFRPGQPELLAVYVDPTALSDVIRPVPYTALVVQVTPDGASDRAGMLVGDLIMRINGQGFTGSLEADTVMRQSAVGRETTYDILRAGQPTRLWVRLAAFGLQFGPLLLLLTGLAYIATGTLLATLRTHIKAARYLGLGWMGTGMAMALVLSRPRRALPEWLLVTTDVFLALAIAFGVAAWLHALHYFPRERETLRARRWVKPATYAFAVLVAGGTLALAQTANAQGPFIVEMVLMLGFGVLVTMRSRRRYSPEDRQISRPTTIATSIAVGFSLVMVATGISRGFDMPPPFGLAALIYIVTLGVHVFVIGRYQLLESDLRVRRNVQYLVVSSAWTLAVAAAGLWFWWSLVTMTLPLPNVRLTGQAVEILPTPIAPARRALIEKAVLIAAAVLFAYAFRAVLKRGHRFLAEQYYQEGYDYRRAAQELADVMGPRMDLDGLADGLLTVIDRLMPVKRAGVAFVQDARIVTSTRSIGFEHADWDLFCRACMDDAVSVLRTARGELDTEYAPPRLRLALRRSEIHHLYPIGGHNELRGVLFIGEKLSESAYTADDFAFLKVIASQAALLVENAFLYENVAQQERVRQELAIARRIQMDSLPQRSPLVAGLDVAGASLPAQEVGGDYFDYLNGTARQLTVMVGDVSGKGTSAALYMSKLQGIVRSLHGFDLSPRELFVRINELIGRDLERRAFVTVLGAFFDSGARQLVLARAGHLPLFHYRQETGKVVRWLPRGMGLGLTTGDRFGAELEERIIPYASGDVFLFVTDGITESHNRAGDDYGEDRLITLLEELAGAGMPVADMVAYVNTTVFEFADGAPQHDDQTVIVVRATG